MSDPTELLMRFCAEADAAKAELQRKCPVPIDDRVLYSVLTERLGLKSSVFLIDQNLDQKRILEIVGDFFEGELAIVEIDRDILPDGVFKLLTEAEVKLNNQVWTLHKNDKDPFPSNPHAHNYATGVKLDLSNGWTYRKRKCAGKIRAKDLLEIREKFQEKVNGKGIDLPVLVK